MRKNHDTLLWAYQSVTVLPHHFQKITPSKNKLEEGQYAIEPFATNGNGKIHDGKPSGIYELRSEKNIRSSVAREVLEFIINEYKTLPFCSRWLVRKIGTKALIGLKQLEENGNLYHHPVLVETSKGIVAQAEHTILIGLANVPSILKNSISRPDCPVKS